MALHIVLFQPEIPQNTGNIARTCAVTGASLSLVHPLGYEISDRTLRRAGLDYWKDVKIEEYESDGAFFALHDGESCYYFSKKARRCYSDVAFDDEVYFIFGRESRGLDESLLRVHGERTLRIPMRRGERSLNLSNAVAIAAYEYFRQKGFPSLEKEDETFFREDV